MLAAGFAGRGWGVLREWPYPDPRARHKQRLPRRGERQRCDLVLLPHEGCVLVDGVREELRQRRALGVLFPDMYEGVTDPSTRGKAPVESTDACWIEVKTVGQVAYADGAPLPNSAWASQIISSITEDVHKLARAEGLGHAGVLLVLFTTFARVGEHDVTMAVHTLLSRETPVRSVRVKSFPILDRVGNASCTVALLGAGRAGL